MVLEIRVWLLSVAFIFIDSCIVCLNVTVLIAREDDVHRVPVTVLPTHSRLLKLNKIQDNNYDVCTAYK